MDDSRGGPDSAAAAGLDADKSDGEHGVGEKSGKTGTERRGQNWRSLLELDAQIHEKHGIRILTPEARVLIHLKLQGTLSVTTAMQLAGVSYRGFYAVLERLKQAGVVSQARDKGDQRVRNLSLDPSMPLTTDNV
ncbi:hypothetical protein [Novosphingobium aquimarinum]|uniref:hypothetical protein n=1 Tax=Novosphingobium aquimarinum TaxID=2682494 RepID=UPI0012EC5CA8|nr:hypothetical protein [Novosphingobium aquimarinum]